MKITLFFRQARDEIEGHGPFSSHRRCVFRPVEIAEGECRIDKFVLLFYAVLLDLEDVGLMDSNCHYVSKKGSTALMILAHSTLSNRDVKPLMRRSGPIHQDLCMTHQSVGWVPSSCSALTCNPNITMIT